MTRPFWPAAGYFGLAERRSVVFERLLDRSFEELDQRPYALEFFTIAKTPWLLIFLTVGVLEGISYLANPLDSSAERQIKNKDLGKGQEGYENIEKPVFLNDICKKIKVH